MIAANEIRIGNYVSLKCGTHVPIADGGILAISQKRFECSPIPLTPEILEKCGLKRHSYEMSGCEVWYLQDTSWRVARSYRDANEYKLWHERITPPTWNLKTFAYLHELQNIIFALTGEELNYTP